MLRKDGLLRARNLSLGSIQLVIRRQPRQHESRRAPLGIRSRMPHDIRSHSKDTFIEREHPLVRLAGCTDWPHCLGLGGRQRYVRRTVRILHRVRTASHRMPLAQTLPVIISRRPGLWLFPSKGPGPTRSARFALCQVHDRPGRHYLDYNRS